LLIVRSIGLVLCSLSGDFVVLLPEERSQVLHRFVAESSPLGMRLMTIEATSTPRVLYDRSMLFSRCGRQIKLAVASAVIQMGYPFVASTGE